MLSGVLNSAVAIQVHIQIIRIFSKMREMMLTNKDILLKLQYLEKNVTENKQDIALIFEALKKLLDPPHEPRQRIGFKPDNLRLIANKKIKRCKQKHFQKQQK